MLIIEDNIAKRKFDTMSYSYMVRPMRKLQRRQ